MDHELTLIPFGLRGGRMVTIDEVDRGLACMATCPACDERLIARKGTARTHHFAHEKGGVCESGLETALHRMAKQLLETHRRLSLPTLRVTETATGISGLSVSASRTAYAGGVLDLDEVRLEVRGDGLIPDAVCVAGTFEFLVEFWVTHKSTKTKRELARAQDLAIVEIRLDPRMSPLSSDTLQEVIETGVTDRDWIWHPATPSARAEARASAMQLLAASERDVRQRRRLHSPGRPQNKRIKRNTGAPLRQPVPQPKAIVLLCDECGVLSDWPTTLPPGDRPECPSCGELISRDLALESEVRPTYLALTPPPSSDD